MSVASDPHSFPPCADACAGSRLGRVVHWLPVVSSTNRVLAAMAEDGALHGTVVIADHQTAGAGKGERAWFSKPGGGLLLSVLLRPDASFGELPQLTLLAAVALHDALARLDLPNAGLKWPNDLLIGGRKVCGILAETGTDQDGEVFVVLGIGLNVGLRVDDFPHELAAIATSLTEAAGRPVDVRAVMEGFLEALEFWLGRWCREGFAPVRAAWCEASCTLGRRVGFGGEGEIGEAVGLADDGGLLVRDRNGDIHGFHSGDMRFLDGACESTQTRSVS